MSRFTDVVEGDTPRLEVRWVKQGGLDAFEWGVLGNIPIFSLIGYVGRVQAELLHPRQLDPAVDHNCDRKSLVIAHLDYDHGQFMEWFCHKDVPHDPLVGYLEVIKQLVVRSLVAQQAGANQVQLVGPDGAPIRR